MASELDASKRIVSPALARCISAMAMALRETWSLGGQAILGEQRLTPLENKFHESERGNRASHRQRLRASAPGFVCRQRHAMGSSHCLLWFSLALPPAS